MRMAVTFEPVVSVLMGVHNGEKTLARAIDSILKQTFCDLEFIICDDGSSDNTGAQLSRYETADNRIRVIRNKRNQGLAPALNRCLNIAKGRYIARMDADDFSYPERLAQQITYLETHPEIAFVGCCAYLQRADILVGKKIFPEYPAVQDFYITQPFLHPSLVLRREPLDAVGGYSESKRCVLCEDYDLLLRLYAKGFEGANLQDILLAYTLPATAKGNRKMKHRWNETVTRYRRFRELGLLPGKFLYVIKPLAVGMVPAPLLIRLKKMQGGGAAKCL